MGFAGGVLLLAHLPILCYHLLLLPELKQALRNALLLGALPLEGREKVLLPLLAFAVPLGLGVVAQKLAPPPLLLLPSVHGLHTLVLH